MCGDAAIQRISRTQTCTTLSSGEAGYVEMAEVCRVSSPWCLRFELWAFLWQQQVRFRWGLTDWLRRTRRTSMFASASCERLSGKESLKSRTYHRVFSTPNCWWAPLVKMCSISMAIIFMNMSEPLRFWCSIFEFWSSSFTTCDNVFDIWILKSRFYAWSYV